jgi:hypothetical protein
MKYYQLRLFLMLFVPCIYSFSAEAQSWDFAKEKDEIKIYTRKEAGKSLKSYKGTADIKAPAEKIFAMLENVNNTDWWDKNLKEIRILLYEKNKRAQYYLIYDLPWPFTDRDLCVDVTVSIDPISGERKITAVPLTGVIPEQKELVRIKDYRQIWIVKPLGKDLSHVILEGHADPAGSVPDFITNMIIVDSPMKIIGDVKQRMEKK